MILLQQRTKQTFFYLTEERDLLNQYKNPVKWSNKPAIYYANKNQKEKTNKEKKQYH